MNCEDKIFKDLIQKLELQAKAIINLPHGEVRKKKRNLSNALGKLPGVVPASHQSS